MLNGYMYNLTNPLYGEDIGMSAVNTMYPTNIDPLTGMPQTYLPGITINSGQPMSDSYVTQKQRNEKAFIKTAIAGLVLVGLGFLGIKKGSTLTKNAISNITAPFKSVWKGIKNLFGGKTPTPPVSPNP